MLHPTWTELTETLPNDLGDPNFLIWTMRWGSETLVTDPLSVFDAPSFWPSDGTLGLSDTMLSLAPWYGLLHAATGAPVLALNLFALSMYVLSLVTSYGLGRWLLTSRWGAGALALTFTFSSYTLGQQSHVQLLTFGLIPLAIHVLLRFLDRGRAADAAVLGAVLVAVAYSVASYLLLSALVLPCIVLVLVLLGHRPSRATLHKGAVALGAAGLACTPLALLYASTSGVHGIVRSYEGMDRFRPTDLLTPTADNLLWGSVLDPVNSSGFVGDHAFMMSVTAYACAVVGLIALVSARGRVPVVSDSDGHLDREHAVWAVLVAGVGSFLLALGPEISGVPGPYRLVYKLVPGFDGVRVTSRFAVVGLLAIALLAAVGVAEVERRLRGRVERRAVRHALLALVVGTMMLEVYSTGPGRAAAWDAPEVAAVYDELADRPDGVVLELPIMSPNDLFSWPFVEAPRMALSVGDRQPRVNGYSGHWPNGFIEDAELLDRFPDADAAQRARELRVRYVVVHTTTAWPEVAIAPADVEAILARLPSGATVERHGEAWLVDLGAQPDGWRDVGR